MNIGSYIYRTSTIIYSEHVCFSLHCAHVSSLRIVTFVSIDASANDLMTLNSLGCFGIYWDRSAIWAAVSYSSDNGELQGLSAQEALWTKKFDREAEMHLNSAHAWE